MCSPVTESPCAVWCNKSWHSLRAAFGPALPGLNSYLSKRTLCVSSNDRGRLVIIKGGGVEIRDEGRVWQEIIHLINTWRGISCNIWCSITTNNIAHSLCSSFNCTVWAGNILVLHCLYFSLLIKCLSGCIMRTETNFKAAWLSRVSFFFFFFPTNTQLYIHPNGKKKAASEVVNLHFGVVRRLRHL